MNNHSGIKDKYKNQKIWFHGTTLYELKKIRDNGIDVYWNMGNELDFGFGFYLTNKKRTAEMYSKTKIKFQYGDVSKEDPDYIEKNTPIIMKFNISLAEMIEHQVRYKVFPKFDLDFSEFVLNNRIKAKDFENPDYYEPHYYHEYDFVFGPITDDNPILLLQNLTSGEITDEQALKILSESNSFGKQISIHNKNLVDFFLSDYEIEIIEK